MANSKDRLRALIEGLYAATTRGDVSWHAVQNVDSYITSIGDGRIEIKEDQNVGGEPIIVVNIYNMDGKWVDSVNDDDLKGSTPVSLPYNNYFLLMKVLHDVARRSATGADKVIEGILRAINAPNIDSDEVPF